MNSIIDVLYGRTALHEGAKNELYIFDVLYGRTTLYEVAKNELYI